MSRSQSKARTRIAAGSIIGLIILASLISLFALYYATQRNAIQEQADIERQIQEREALKNEIRDSLDTVYMLNGSTLTVNTTNHYTQAVIYWGLLIYFGGGNVYILTDKNLTGEGVLATLQQASLLTPANTVYQAWSTATGFQSSLPLAIPPGYTLSLVLQVSSPPATIKGVVGAGGTVTSSVSYVQAPLSVSTPPLPSSGVLYRTPVTLTYTGSGSSGSGITLLSLDSSWPGWDNVRPDGSDIYITDWNGVHLRHQILRWNYTAQKALIAVETPSIPSWQPLTIYIYYGPNSPGYTGGLTSILFWDDFDGTSLNTTKWDTNAAGLYNVSNSILNLWGSWNENTAYLNTRNSFTAPLYIYVLGKITVPYTDSDLAVIASSSPTGYVWYSSTSTKTVVTYKIDDEDSSSQRWKWNEIYVSSTDNVYDDTYDVSTISGVWVLIEAYYSTSYVWMHDNATNINLTLAPTITLSSTVYLGLAGDSDDPARIDQVDYILATKEPLLEVSQSIGGEEQAIATIPAPRPGDVWPGDFFNYSYQPSMPQKPGYLLFDDFSDGTLDWAVDAGVGITFNEDALLGALVITGSTTSSTTATITRYLAGTSTSIVVDALVGGHLDSGDGSLFLYRTIALRASGTNDLGWYAWNGFAWEYIGDSTLEDRIGRALLVATDTGRVYIYEDGVYIGSYDYTTPARLGYLPVTVSTDGGGQFTFQIDSISVYTNTSISMVKIPVNTTVTFQLEDIQGTTFNASFTNITCGSITPPPTIYVDVAGRGTPYYTLTSLTLSSADPSTIWTHRIPITITAGSWPLQGIPVVVKINFTDILESLGDTSGIIDPDSIRVQDPGGVLVEYNMTWNSQFDPASPTHDNAWGWLVFRIDIPAGESVTYTVYFTTQDCPKNPPATTLPINYAKIQNTAISTTGEVPDQYYYPLNTSLEGFIPWVDNAGPTIVSGDDVNTAVSLPFSFPYYDTTLGSIYVCTNGFLSVASLTDFSDSVPELISRKEIAAFWDDLYVRSGEYIERIDTTYYGLATVRFHYYVSYYSSVASKADFAVTLFENGIIVLQWNRIDRTNSYTIGISNGASSPSQYIVPYSSTNPGSDQDIYTTDGYIVGHSIVFLPRNLYTYTFGPAVMGYYTLS